MKDKRGLIVSGNMSGSTVRIYDEFWKLKDGSGWAPKDWDKENDENYEKWYLVISEDVPMGGPKPRMKKSENIKIFSEK